MLKIDKDNYSQYKRVFEIFWQHYAKLIETEAKERGLDFNYPSPLEVLNGAEAQSKSLALKSLKASFSDTFTMLKYAPYEFKKQLDDDLKTNALPGYFEIYAEAKDSLPTILKKQLLRSLDEYYFVMEMLNDTASEISTEEREILNKCVLAFEQKHAKKK
ncbi:hypothetical protein [Mucilaginibacter pedocola]|uniref:Uncharacterized protein n=1 Tax=Mucilaginibacter pedocola TaxID=1792845 RepID=A0A1S9P7E3_9SPHI|nr:hypothetical protein [Mucilaginibacter pedocola]OOQ56859.1 hypothetical protein BC343_17930 [Mucilaginibacter pedocola]